MKYKSIFDIIGPIMVGPSSSHTAGAVRIGQIARRIFGMEPEEIHIHFYGSFAETYKGHATDIAVIAGLLDFETDDPRIQDAILIAQKKGIQIHFYTEEMVPSHPNTLEIKLVKGDETLELTGISVGGGAVQISELNGFSLNLSGENPAMLIYHKDAYGVVASVAVILANHKINISRMNVSRIERDSMALMVIETDQTIQEEILKEIGLKDNVKKVYVLSA